MQSSLIWQGTLLVEESDTVRIISEQGPWREFLFSALLRNVGRFRMRNLFRFLLLNLWGTIFWRWDEESTWIPHQKFLGVGWTLFGGGGKIYIDFSPCQSISLCVQYFMHLLYIKEIWHDNFMQWTENRNLHSGDFPQPQQKYAWTGYLSLSPCK